VSHQQTRSLVLSLLFPKQIADAVENKTRQIYCVFKLLLFEKKKKKNDFIYQVHPSVIPLDVFNWARNGRFVHDENKSENPAESI
jgi:hypothetical protein